MARLPRFDPGEVATESDLGRLKSATKSDFALSRFAQPRSGFAELRSGTRSDIAELRPELRGGLAALDQRLDGLFLPSFVGLFGVVAAMVDVILRVT